MTTTGNDYRSTRIDGISDLTLFAPIASGAVPDCLDVVSHRTRSEQVLKLLHELLRVSREASAHDSGLPDSVGQFRGIHFFRFAVLDAARNPSDAAHAGEHDKLFLNVTFDGGWEPYMRIIWGPLGTMLDLIFCSVDGYPRAYASDFETYTRWVRSHEAPSQFFYSDDRNTIADDAYRTTLENWQRQHGDAPDADRQAAELSARPELTRAAPTPAAVRAAVSSLVALYSLRRSFPGSGHEGDHGVLLRFCQDFSAELRRWVAEGHFDEGGAYAELRSGAAGNAIDWLMQDRYQPEPAPPRHHFALSDVQAGIARGYPSAVRHGVVGLYAIDSPERARHWLSGAGVVTLGNETPKDGIYRQVALSYQGLERLGVPAWRLRRLPQEFIEGMEERAGLLGDIRGNHPAQWQRPTTARKTQIPLDTVHVIVQLRASDPALDSCEGGPGAAQVLRDELDALGATQGVRLLTWEAMSLNRPSPDGSRQREHFGFVDGISQPKLAPRGADPVYWDDKVGPGEMFLGYGSQRDPGPSEPLDDIDGDNQPDVDLLLDNGSFLVVRKLQQHLDHLEQVLSAATTSLPTDEATARRERLLELMMGRRMDGEPLITQVGADPYNDFDYASDPLGRQCPLASHVRRANPREAERGLSLPRIVRRGMSYGPPPEQEGQGADRGLFFMAYCASIAEQFEVIQRWLSGGNSTALSSAQDDPIVGVPRDGFLRQFRCVDGDEVVRVDLGEKPLVSLQWGLYAFVPSPLALQSLAQIANSQQPRRGNVEPPPPAQTLGPAGERWRLSLEERATRDKTWARVFADDAQQVRGVVRADDYGVLVANASLVQDALQDDGKRYSVGGYGERMTHSLGLGFLGQDNDGPHAGHAAPFVDDVNRAIETFVDEEGAYGTAHAIAKAVLGTVQGKPGSINFLEFGGAVLALLCRRWFGLPDDRYVFSRRPAAAGDPVATCPGDFLAVSRYVFSTPHPSPGVVDTGQEAGTRIKAAIREWLGATAPEAEERGPLTKRILAGDPGDWSADKQAELVGGIMLGFPPTVLLNLVQFLAGGVLSRRLWEWQYALQEDMTGADIAYSEAAAILRQAAFDSMRNSAVPYAVWRTAGSDFDISGCPVKAGERIALGLGAVTQNDPEADDWLVFGGERGGSASTVHACPGHAIAFGVMLGATVALLEQGTLLPTASPIVVDHRPG